MKITNKEIEAVSQLEAFQRYEYFIKRVADSEKMYTLVDENGTFAIADVENSAVLSVWSASKFAEENVVDEWRSFSVKEITLEEFEEEIIDMIEKNNWLMNVFSIKGKSGFIVDINEFAKDLSVEMQKYH
nr:DUF2750 domain-containing protein [uncultured Bacteroides sp.]